jgi:phosphate transport system ATP-binding protein
MTDLPPEEERTQVYPAESRRLLRTPPKAPKAPKAEKPAKLPRPPRGWKPPAESRDTWAAPAPDAVVTADGGWAVPAPAAPTEPMKLAKEGWVVPPGTLPAEGVVPGTPPPGYASGYLAAPMAPPVAEKAPLAELQAQNLSAWFGDHQVLDRVSLTMPAGVVTSLIGPSGCGKSTFLRILNRMHELVPSASLAGEVLLDGADIYDGSRRLIDARKSIGMVFQKPNPFPAMSIYDNVVAGLGLTGTRASRDERDYLVESCLIKAGLWKEVRDRLRAPGGGLSGGQQQRLCIARSLAVTPRVLLMDEPCSALDPTSTRVIEETMLELVNDVTIVIVTHNMQQAQRVSTQCAFFLASQGQPGSIVEHGSTEAMFSDPIDSRTFDYVNGRFG